ncbi:MAG: hypothetical protein V4547_04505 [Bacteroidota bacterium]
MRKYFTIIILLSVTLFQACHKKEMAGSKTIAPVNTPSPTASSEIKNVIVDSDLDIATIGGALTNIDSLAIKGDVLSIFVNYSGGCKDHSFDLYSNGMYAKSLPPKLTLFLKQTDNDDGCRSLINQELKFNISAVKYTSSLSLKVGSKFIKYEPK